MPAYSSDKEQVEELKELWKEYGRWILLAVVVGLAVSYGWRYWQARKYTTNIEASDQYQSLLVATENNNWTQVAAKKIVLEQQFPKSSYTAYANFVEAQNYVNQANYDKALADYAWVLNNNKNSIYEQLARVRSARLLMAQNKVDAAGKMLATVNNKAFMPAINSIKGDIAVAKNDVKKAGKYYQDAFVGFESQGVSDPVLMMKVQSYAGL